MGDVMCGRYQISISNADIAAIVAEAQKRASAVLGAVRCFYPDGKQFLPSGKNSKVAFPLIIFAMFIL
jgi:hypothetical protein